MFADVEADIYVMVDGDGTYAAASAPAMVQMLVNGPLDMVTAVRSRDDQGAYRAGHKMGNTLITGMIARIFGDRMKDVLSGYRVFSRRFVKSFPALSRGFEIETELTVHALELRMPIADQSTLYKQRPEGSISKLSTYRDGFRILKTILLLVKEERPLGFFTAIFAMLAMGSLLLAWPLLFTYLETGLVPRFPTAILATGMMLSGLLSLGAGLVLDTVTRGRRELRRLSYLRHLEKIKIRALLVFSAVVPAVTPVT